MAEINDNSTAAGITIYSKHDCPACDLTQRTLEKAGIKFDIKELEQLTDEELQAFRDKGLMQAPIVVTSEGTFAGFRPDRVKAIIAAHEPITQAPIDPIKETAQGLARNLPDLPLEGLSEVLSERILTGFMTLRRATSIDPNDLMAINEAIEPGITGLQPRAQTRATITAWEFATNIRPIKSAIIEWQNTAPDTDERQIRNLLSHASAALKPTVTPPNRPQPTQAKKQGYTLS